MNDPLGAGWTCDDARDLYRVAEWGEGYFVITDDGSLVVRPRRGEPHAVRLRSLVEELQRRQLDPPWIIRFGEILEDRVQCLEEAFNHAIGENEYQGSYQPVYPIKVNQQRATVERIVSSSRCGLEVGSKPELLAVISMTHDDPERLIVCNGFKDGAYVEGVVLATRLGRNMVTVVENRNELGLLLAQAQRHGVRPQIGARVKLTSTGAGRWRSSAGSGSKFGLFATELLDMVATLREHDMLDCLRLVHAHAGSQLQDIRRVKEAVGELAHVYVELRNLGAPVEYLDIGGGLGVDYDGCRANAASSMNYSLAEYANEVVYRVGSICDDREVPHPVIVTESGRAITAHHAVLVFEAVATIERDVEVERSFLDKLEDAPQALRDLGEAYEAVDEARALECFHDAVTARRQAIELFAQGYLSLELRGLAEQLFFATCARVRRATAGLDELPDELEPLDVILADTYVSNLSIFQSLPDAWAIRQRFPIMPIDRLDEAPTRQGVLADVTCDSDGQIDRFGGQRQVSRVLPLHELREGNPYFLGAFLVGAYQETLGDLHNLFGDPHVAVVEATPNGHEIIEVVAGDTAQEVLSYVSYDTEAMRERFEAECASAVKAGRLREAESEALVDFYRRELGGYTYLREGETEA